jgi:transaldolase
MVKLFYDGCDIQKYGAYPNIAGFTTNPTIMKQAAINNYRKFYNDNVNAIGGRPISMQVFSDNPSIILEQAKQIYSIGSNVIVKIPVVTSNGESNLNVIQEVLNNKIPINITAVFTEDQINEIASYIMNTSTPVIVSIFAGRISDTGKNPKEIVKIAVDTFKSNSNIEILWAGVKDNLVINNSDEIGCHIATLPDTILSRINRLGQPLQNLSKDTVKSFLQDALSNNLSIN